MASPSGEAFKVLRELGDETESEEARKIFYKMSGMESRILSSYLSVLADGGLSLWADPAVRDATATSDFSIHTLRSAPASIFIVVAPNDLVPLAPLIRLMFKQTIANLQRTEPKKEKGESFPVLFLLDEFVSLGRMDVLSSAITTLRSYGGRVMIVVQTIASLRDLYHSEQIEAGLGPQVLSGRGGGAVESAKRAGRSQPCLHPGRKTPWATEHKFHSDLGR